ncbi:LmeA family phospholipid-binding protein [Corynebacterium sp. TAE3-ERU12]|uniref:LmeA family phospholipid-binding protein n=1 Tax=Corynebacterium sp. TAE3-ERU12 TaxID=2849491 RepID=UPI001C437ECF|nr:LmeA family phospholipid-binding protein [Corynebacterium sp. TAE3-ERU12]
MPYSRRTRIIATAAAAILGTAAVADTALAIHAEHTFANTLREDANLPAAPYTSLGGVAYTSSFITGQWSSIKARARDIDIPGLGLVTVESGAVNAEVPAKAILTGKFTEARTKKYFTRIQLDAVALGGLIDVPDLRVRNLEDESPSGGWETEALLEGTPKGCSEPAEVAVKLRIWQGTVHITPYQVRHNECPLSDRDVMDIFTLTLPGDNLPLADDPTRIYVAGGAIYIENEQREVQVSADDFLPRSR